ncbi:sugar-binding domain-containing protein [Sphingobacterium kitahiroshimense]|uniref:sugar-binding domain-containing protein n=1 Tax=Sphingobacterium kitahiroshimense TaxID=470446 RepID=UPI003208B39A
MIKQYLGIFLFLFSLHFSATAQEHQKLDGVWRFRLDEKNVGLAQGWQKQDLDKRITIPGTTDQARYGEKTTGSDFGILTRAYKYYGPSWYQMDFVVPANWKDKRLYLNLERVMDTKEMEIGFREITASKSKITVYGKPVFFRGNLDCVHFPLKGYPAVLLQN